MEKKAKKEEKKLRKRQASETPPAANPDAEVGVS